MLSVLALRDVQLTLDVMLAAVRQQQTVWRRHTKTRKPHRVGGSALGYQSTI